MKKILELIKSQPKGLKKMANFIKIVDIYNSSTYLKTLKLSKKAFNLLNKGRVNIDNLDKFYKIFKIKNHIFFIEFISLKNSYISKRKSIKKEKEKYIYQNMISLPKEIKDIIKELAKIELNYAKRDKKRSFWQKTLYPTTKKGVNDFLKFNNIDWFIHFDNFISKVQKKYSVDFGNRSIKKRIALFVLGIYKTKVTVSDIKEFRRLAMVHHPDRGGDAKSFKILQQSKELLIGN